MYMLVNTQSGQYWILIAEDLGPSSATSVRKDGKTKRPDGAIDYTHPGSMGYLRERMGL